MPVEVVCKSTKGVIHLDIHPEWSPHGASRFLDLVKYGYWHDIGLFRRNPWIVQFGAIQFEEHDGEWKDKLVPKGRHHLPSIPDDPKTDCGGKCVRGSLFDGALSYAGGGVNSRADQIFIVHHRGKSQPLGAELWETPFGNVTKGLDIVRSWYREYGETVDQVKIMRQGSAYLKKNFPDLDYIESCSIANNKEDIVVQPIVNKKEGIVNQKEDVDTVSYNKLEGIGIVGDLPLIMFVLGAAVFVLVTYRRKWKRV
uniref:PPIase cyclophilin-type domain-containing protein n=1 Tax=Mucochytrium quahogii TaxID=96639 RepID=A0A7S2RS89_9STRA|mmetsp:Transcript_3397/g.4908  ORF Transcript_3397/g.4908 Transcript_3397/m.4908 type:complete len:255 (-) Transcript_3397:999-1763(-)|eukprot:CAMPEP_0203764860 /NCGR_PEP_ID=MMETSP0098-20131031/18097_1 /ASSEMBLY_ACC=CAM_ASM_000208 /TAXON_ID=96639 /ORGANISM=" , Strain NY0313808BC1" /LENGTH=254 /DNA_ID=CAMNT_0050661061 /DNA_START=147 /DNA_END=911 /DNA_ORIENTATION=+